MMDFLIDNKMFGIVLSLATFELAKYIFKKTKNPVCNPLLISTLIIIGILTFFKIPLSYYNDGSSVIEFFLAPATVVLVVPLFRQVELLKKYYVPILVGGIVGSITAISSVYFLGKLLGLDKQLVLSFLPKSITTPFGIEASTMLGGIPSITVFAICVTGITGNILAPYIYKIMGEIHPIAKGVGLGVSSHAVGTSKALEMGEVEGAMSALSIVVAGVITVLIIQVLIRVM
ncbi:MAG: LrgB family protein [Fusobacteriaceae bacterium]